MKKSRSTSFPKQAFQIWSLCLEYLIFHLFVLTSRRRLESNEEFNEGDSALNKMI